MSVKRAKQEIPHREYLAWLEFLEEEWNRPSRSDYYAMQIAAKIVAVNSKHPQRSTTDSMKIKFVEREPELSPEDQAAKSEFTWFSVLDGMRKRILNGK